MIVISNASPLIALSRCGHLTILKQLFGNVRIPQAVLEETVLESTNIVQKERIGAAIGDFIQVLRPRTDYPFSRNLGKGERGVLNLALEIEADILIIDDKKARNEAHEHGFLTVFTTDIFKAAEKRSFIPSYNKVLHELSRLGIYLPD